MVNACASTSLEAFLDTAAGLAQSRRSYGLNLYFPVGFLPKEWAQMPLQILNLSDNLLSGILLTIA